MSPNSASTTVVIAGASSAIGQQIFRTLTVMPDVHIITLSRGETPQADASMAASHQHLTVDLSDKRCLEQLSGLWQSVGCPNRVYHCSGVLHDDSHRPEKSIREFDADWLMQSVSSNLVTHAHLAQSLHSHINRKTEFRWISLSAKVGSISDNGLGGWYSYRMTKAALNMLICNLDIEWRRKNPAARVCAVHPGTTDTPLSKPFQEGIAEGKLYSVEQTAERMMTIMENLTEQQSGKLLFWDGSLLPF